MKWSDFFARRRGEFKPLNLSESIRLGTEAQALIESAAYSRAMDRLRVQIHEGWAASPVEDRDGQHQLRLLLRILDSLEQHIKDEADDGKIARKQIEEQRMRNEQIKKVS